MKKCFLVLIILFSSCSNLNLEKSRSVASLKRHSCKDYFLAIIKNTGKSADESKFVEDKIEEDLERYILKRASKYWKWHENVTKTRKLTAALRPLRTRLIRIFQNINRNQIPVIYIGDKDESLITLSKINEIYEKNIEVKSFENAIELMQQARSGSRNSRNRKRSPEEELMIARDVSWKRLGIWIRDYETYKVRLAELTRKYMSLSYNLDFLRRVHSSPSTSFPMTQSLDIYSKFYDENENIVGEGFKKIIEPFENREALFAYIQKLRDEKRSIVSQRLTVKGSRRQLELEHAKNARRLKFFYDQVKSVYLTAKRSGTPIEKDLEELYLKVENLIKNRPDLLPSPNIVIKLEGHEINREFLDIFKAVSESVPVKTFEKLYALLTDAEKARLELDEAGLIGRGIRILANNKVYRLAVTGVGALATGGTAIFYSEEFINFFRGDQRRIDICTAKKEDNEFHECLVEFLKDKFSFDRNPFLYLTMSDQGLLDELNGNMEVVNDLKAIVKKATEQRANEVEDAEAQREIQEQLDKAVLDIVKNRKGDEGTLIKPRSLILNLEE